jgi:hypothetical protein
MDAPSPKVTASAKAVINLRMSFLLAVKLD